MITKVNEDSRMPALLTPNRVEEDSIMRMLLPGIGKTGTEDRGQTHLMPLKKSLKNQVQRKTAATYRNSTILLIIWRNWRAFVP